MTFMFDIKCSNCRTRKALRGSPYCYKCNKYFNKKKNEKKRSEKVVQDDK